MPGDLTIKNYDNSIATITRVAPDSSRGTLGTFLSPSDNMGPQLEKLKAKVRTFADYICTGRISRQDTEYGMHI